MKVAVVLASNTIYAPYLYHYKKILEEQKVHFDIILWNKDNIKEENCISYDESSSLQTNRVLRIRPYFRYARFVKEVLTKGEYDRVVIFTIFLGVILSRFLKSKYYKRYVFDVRDHSPFLNYLPKTINSVINNAYVTAISSPGFRQWLPQGDFYVLSHNYQFPEDKMVTHEVTKSNIILTIGILREFDVNKKFMESMQHSKNFTLKFVGKGVAYLPLLNYAADQNIKNVIFTGEYKKSDELRYLQDVAFMNILGGNDKNSRTLMANRFYLAISNSIPVLVSCNTTQADYVTKYDLGIVVNEKDILEDLISFYLDTYNQAEFEKKCRLFLEDLRDDQKEFVNTFKQFISA